MSDPDLHDPIDEAYRRAEVAVSDDAARAARRARVLGATEAEPAAAPISAPRTRRFHPAWMATAAAALVSVVVAVNIPRPVRVSPPPSPPSPLAATPAAPTAATPSSATPPAVPAAQNGDAVEKSGRAKAAETRLSEGVARLPPLAAPPPRMTAKPALAALPQTAASPLPLPPVPAPVVQARSLSPRPPPAPQAPTAPTASIFADREQAEPQRAKALDGRRTSPSGGVANAPPEPAERMRAAAAAGRTGEVEVLLAQGVPVDAADSEGETALMKSVRAGHPTTAALLRRRGANVNLANKSGETARDLAAAKADAQLDKALDPPR